MIKIINAFVFKCVVLMLSGCVLPAYHLLEDAGQPYQIVSSFKFKHLLAVNSHIDIHKPVIVFIEGDGHPWRRHNRVAFEPTPDKPLLLEWFLEADFPAIYLGRPCYFELNDQQCSPYWYTHGRYSETVVKSLVQVLSENVTGKNIVLVGHSGGATLAVLMADMLGEVEAVVTIAGNLQVNAWSDYHHYSKLQGSMDPMFSKLLPEHIRQIHLYSPFDKVIQAEWIKSFSEKQMNSRLLELPVQGHDKGWKEFYPMFKKILSELHSDNTGANIE